VNLATYLLIDAFDNDCEQAIVISNDSDLVTPIQFARERFGIPVGIFNRKRTVVGRFSTPSIFTGQSEMVH